MTQKSIQSVERPGKNIGIVNGNYKYESDNWTGCFVFILIDAVKKPVAAE